MFGMTLHQNTFLGGLKWNELNKMNGKSDGVLWKEDEEVSA